MNQIRVGFLLTNSKAHVYHIAPIAFALSMDARFAVQLFISTAGNAQIVSELATHYPDHCCQFVSMQPGFLHRLGLLFKKRAFPKEASVQRHHLKDFLACDALVTSDQNLKYILSKDKHHKIKKICTRHGAGDRAYGFSSRLKDFDLVLTAGEPILERMITAGVIGREQGRVVGYPKFDVTLKSPVKKLFDNDRPVVLYNPHFEAGLSSWPVWGERILKYFYESVRYNLIFAPHINLFAKNKWEPPQQYLTAPHMHIDIDSVALCDMTYTRAADIYVGDVSSQVYEFLVQPRPCVFLNADQAQWRGNDNYQMWRLGDVLENKGQAKMEEGLDKLLASAVTQHKHYKALQEASVERLFSQTDVPASKRAAETIVDFLLSEKTK